MLKEKLKFKNSRKAMVKALSNIIPKQKGFLLFYPTHNKMGFSGNLRSLFIYMYENKDKHDYKITWCTSSKKTYAELKEKNYPVIFHNTLVKYYLLRAEHIIQDSTYGWLIGNFSIVQLWHGNGFKHVALLDKTVTEKRLKALREVYPQYKMIAASSVKDKQFMISSFENENVYVVGSPKNDVFFREDNLSEQLKSKYGLAEFDKIYSYTPTYRDSGVFNPFDIIFWEQLQTWLIVNNAVFVIKKHPWDKEFNVPATFSNIKDLTNEISDVQELLLFTDVLISDYSAIVTDFALTAKPMLFYFYDYSEYISLRDFYYELDEVLPGPFINDSESLLSAIKDLSWFDEVSYQEKYAKFVATFHQYVDGNSSKRVLEQIQKLN